MALTVAEYKAEIPEDIGVTPDVTMTARIDKWWSMFEDQFGWDNHILYLIVRRKAILWLRGGNWKKYDWAEADVKRNESQMFKHLGEMLADLDLEILAYQKTLGGGIQVGQIIGMTSADPKLPQSWPHVGKEPDPVLTNP